MGCGSSSLKGEKVDDIKPSEPTTSTKGMKRVKTNFSEVDFSGEQSNNRRGTVALAPDEQRRPTRVSETTEADIQAPNAAADVIQEEPDKEPYHEPEGLTSTAKETPTVKLPDATDPTSRQAKDEFATTNDPAHNQKASSSENDNTGLIAPEEPSRRKSWLARFAESRRDKSMDISDEELKKTIGMTRAEFEEWKKDPKNAVGGRQQAEHSGFIGGGGSSG